MNLRAGDGFRVKVLAQHVKLWFPITKTKNEINQTKPKSPTPGSTSLGESDRKRLIANTNVPQTWQIAYRREKAPTKTNLFFI